MSRPPISLVVPLYNEQERFVDSADSLAEFVTRHGPESELILVDDGSTDKTLALAEDFAARQATMRCRVVSRPHRGKGAAVQAGIEAAERDWVAFCDVDLATPLDDLERIIAAATLNDVLVLGSRDVVGSQLIQRESWMRELLGKLFNRAVQFAVLPGISDTQCGSKAASRRVWTRVLPHCREQGFAWDVEVAAVARRMGIPVQEVAISWRHDDRSRVRVGRDGAAMVLALANIRKRVGALPAEHVTTRGGVFDSEQAATLVEADSDHWWFRSKAALVASMLRHHSRRVPHDGALIDVGAGAGGVTALLGWAPDELVAVEGSHDLLSTAVSRHAILGVVALGEQLPFRDGSVSATSLLDVIEHLDDPGASLRQARAALRDGGVLVVTVPAHEWLWSGADELLGHVRRYTRRRLRAELEASGFEIVAMSHVFSWLVAPAWLQRRLTKDANKQLGLEQTSPLIDRVALLLTRIEESVVKRVSLPLGTSILAVATPSDRRPSGKLN